MNLAAMGKEAIKEDSLFGEPEFNLKTEVVEG